MLIATPTPLTSIPPKCLLPVVISVVAPNAGVVRVKGCYAQTLGSIQKEFILPLLSADEEEKRTKRASMLILEEGRIKRAGLLSRPFNNDIIAAIEKSSSSKEDLVTKRFLDCRVVAAQPLLKIRRTSLTHGAVILYDGET